MPDEGNRGRRILFPRRLLQQARAYIAVERAHAIAKFWQRSGWQSIENPIFVLRERSRSRLRLLDGGDIALDQLSPDERGRTIVCDDGVPCEPAVLWLTELACQSSRTPGK